MVSAVIEPGTTVLSTQNCLRNSSTAATDCALLIAGVYAPVCPARKSPPPDHSQLEKYQEV